MIDLARRSLVVAAGSCLVALPGTTQAGDHPWFHHHGYYSRTTTVSNGVPVTGLVGGAGSSFSTTQAASSFPTVVPASSFSTLVPASSFVMSVPASSFAMSVPASSFAMSIPASSFPTIQPASSFPAVLPASNASSGFGSSGFAASSFSPMAAAGAATARAHAASDSEARSAHASFPNLAAAAQRRNLHGGRFVVFLRSLLSGSLAQLAGPIGAEAITFLRPLIHDFIRNQLGADPAEPGIGREIESLLGGLLGGGGGGGGGFDGGTSGDGCFTIRVCIDGGTPKATVDGVAPATPSTGGNNRFPLFGLPAAGPSGQAPASQQGGFQTPVTPANDSAPPAPAAPDEPVAPTPAPPAPGAPASTRNSKAKDDDGARHAAIMNALIGINDTLKQLVEVKSLAAKAD